MGQEIESSTWCVGGTRFHHVFLVFLVHKMFFLVHKMRRATLLPFFRHSSLSWPLQGYQIDWVEHQSIAIGGTKTKVFSSPQLFITHFFSSTTWNQMLMIKTTLRKLDHPSFLRLLLLGLHRFVLRRPLLFFKALIIHLSNLTNPVINLVQSAPPQHFLSFESVNHTTSTSV